MKCQFDIDIDFADRNTALVLIPHVPASIKTSNKTAKHNSGIYVTPIPTNSITGNAAIDYKQAEDRGYFKFDFLNVTLYQQVKSEQHLIDLMNTEPNWALLYDKEFCKKVIHVGNHYNTLIRMPEPVDSIVRLAMSLAVIRPGKKHLIGKPWKEVEKTVWSKPSDGSFAFKMSHSVGYSHLVVVHMNLLTQSVIT